MRSLLRVVAGLALLSAVSGCAGRELYSNVPTPVDFGDVLVGTTKDLPAQWKNVKNYQVTVMLYQFKPGGVPFTVQNPTLPNNVPANGRTVPVTIRFTPTAKGQVTAKIRPKGVTSIATGLKARSIPLKGNGVMRIRTGLVIGYPDEAGGNQTEDALDFGKVAVGTGKSVTFFFEGVTPNALRLTRSTTPDQNNFSTPQFINIPAQGVGPGGIPNTLTADFSFHPQAKQKYQDLVIYKDASGTRLFAIVLIGEGIAGS